MKQPPVVLRDPKADEDAKLVLDRPNASRRPGRGEVVLLRATTISPTKSSPSA